MTDDRVQRTAHDTYYMIVDLFRGLRQFRVDGELTPNESFALSRIDDVSPITASDLADLEGISAQTMGSTLSGLQARGLVSRSKDARDARRTLFELTPDGHAVLERKRGARIDQLAKVLTEQFTEEEVDRLAAATPVLVKLAHAIG